MKLALGVFGLVCLGACASGLVDADGDPSQQVDESESIPGDGGRGAKNGDDDRDPSDKGSKSDGGSSSGNGSGDGGANGDGGVTVDSGSDSGGGTFTMTTETIEDSASSGTPDTYVRNVKPGGPVTASITGGGGGSWTVNASNGTSTGVYCSGSPYCSFTVPAGVSAIMVTAVTTDIGYYKLTITRPVQ